MSDITGLSRREMYVDARDLQSQTGEGESMSPEEYVSLLVNRGIEKLTENQLVRSFSSVVRTLDPTYVYGKDFFLGDTITVTDEQLGVTADAVVMAVQRSFSKEGESLSLTLGYGPPTLYDILKRKVGK